MAEENIVIGAKTKHQLNGILTIPDQSAGPVPAVVLVHGSGPSNMDAQTGSNTPFKDLAEGLSEKGIAVLRYDKRTYIYANELKENHDLSVKEETIEDAILAADLLRNDPRIDPKKIFIVGHSLGGMLAPRIDAEGGDFAGLIMLAGSPRQFEELLIEQDYNVANSLNWFLKGIAKKQTVALEAKMSNLYEMSDEEAKMTPVLGKHVMAYYFKEMGEHPSVDYLKKLDKPLLILQGGKDVHVSVDKDFDGYKALLGDRANASFKLYPNLNHLLMPAVYGEIRKAKKEYQVAQHVDSEVIDDIAEWILTFNS